MAKPDWKTFEEQVRGIATLIFGEQCAPGRIAGVNFDGVVKHNDFETIAIEISKQEDLDKIRQGIARLTLARQALIVDSVVLRGYIVIQRAPTQAMLEAAAAGKVQVVSAGQFATLFFHFSRYRDARVNASFGSSINPISGEVDQISYIQVDYQQIDGSKSFKAGDLARLLLDGKKIILLGEYGTGKSRCVREVFSILSQGWAGHFRFPYAINLRECWGLDRGEEIIRRGSYVLGLDDLAPHAVRAKNRDSLILLLDGFDELGSQSWSTDESRLRQLRARALHGVKDLIGNSNSGCMIAGREHYFSSNDEMMNALGLDKNNTLIIKAQNEFTDEELEAYFDAAGLIVELPSWLPRKPLICQTIALLSDAELESMFGITSEGVEFWTHFINIVCKRDARINAFFDADTIYNVFVALSRITRSRPANIGPISQRDLQDAFEAVVGQLPVEEASAMLQRLPSLGRIGAESQDRQFIDMFILDGLRAKDVAKLASVDDAQRKSAFTENWLNPLESLGQSILTTDIGNRVDTWRQIAVRAAASRNGTLAADIISALGRSSAITVDLQGLKISGGSFSEFSLVSGVLRNFSISDSTFEHLVLPSVQPSSVFITKSLATKISGVASYAGLPHWAQFDDVDSFDSVQTVAQIKKAGLSPSLEILVAILKKTFKQKGAGRKEEALLRGFGSSTSKKTASLVIRILMQEKILSRSQGDEGWVYIPNRGESGRILTLLEQLRSSEDPLWIEVAALSN